MFAAPPTTTASVENAVIVQSVANMHSKPAIDAEVVSQAIFSTNVGVLERNADWLRVRTPDDYTGWIQSSSAIKSKPYAQAGDTAQVSSLFASLYRDPDITKHQPVIMIPFESKLEVTGPPVDERFVPVRLPDDRKAWVQAGDISPALPKMTIAEVVDWSKRFIGLPYLWGGTSTFGYDCSGFTQMLYRRLGYSLPRDAGPQANWEGVKPVEKADLQPGDLLYFGPSPQKITHTGMYIGDGQFINATAYQHPIVQVCNLGDEHWTKLLVAARRLK